MSQPASGVKAVKGQLSIDQGQPLSKEYFMLRNVLGKFTEEQGEWLVEQRISGSRFL